MPNLPLLLGHRGTGFSALVAENSFAAFDTALEHGCDGFEFDVRATGCGRALVCHDATARGITVARAEADELTDLPMLEDVLQRYGPRAFLDIELKVAGIETKVLTALRECPPEHGFVASSFIADVVLDLQLRSATIPTGILLLTRLLKWQPSTRHTPYWASRPSGADTIRSGPKAGP